MTTAWYPYSQRIKAAKTMIEAVKKFPADETIQKNLAMAWMRDKGGIKAIIMNELMEGKLQEALDLTNEVIDLYIDIEGFSVRTEIMATPVEAWGWINMPMPE